MNEKLKNKINEIRSSFEISDEKSAQISQNFYSDMYEKSMLKMLPTYIVVPKSLPTAECLTIDLGGSNLRVAKFKTSNKSVKSEEIRTIPLVTDTYDYTSADYTLKDIFTIAAVELSKIIDKAQKYNLVLTFSFAIKSTSKLNASVLGVSKGFNVREIFDRDLSILLKAVIDEQKLNITPTAIINDSVATLINGKFHSSNADIAIITGTGHNACFVNKNNEIINIESAFFSKDLPLTQFDKKYFETNPKLYNSQLEILVGGKYIGSIAKEILSYLCPDNDYSYITTTSLTKILESSISSENDELLYEIAKILFRRAAKLIVAEIAAVIKFTDADLSNNHTIIFDGSVYEKTKYFRNEIETELAKFFKKDASKISCELIKNASSIGAAIIANQ